MKNSFIFKVFLIFLTLFVSTSYFVCAEDCDGCLSSSVCYAFGENLSISGVQKYCSFYTGSFVQQKANGADCMNDFECTSGSCLDDKCIDLQAQLAGIENLTGQINETQINQVPCSYSPGCLNSSLFNNITNGQNTSGLCLVGFKCFRCNDDYSWNSSSGSCYLMPCDYTPGCLNRSNLSNARNLNRVCSSGYNCFKCNEGYSWNSSASECQYVSYRSYIDPFWSRIFTVNSQQFTKGYNIELREKQALNVNIKGAYYLFGLISLDSSKAIFNISRMSSQFTFKPGNSQEFDVDKEGLYDAKLILNSIKSDKANITLMAIEEVVKVVNNTQEIDNSGDSGDNQNSEDKSNRVVLTLIISFLAILIIAVIVIAIIVISKSRKANPTLEVKNLN